MQQGCIELCMMWTQREQDCDVLPRPPLQQSHGDSAVDASDSSTSQSADVTHLSPSKLDVLSHLCSSAWQLISSLCEANNRQPENARQGWKKQTLSYTSD
jgi:hypothetical protein